MKRNVTTLAACLLLLLVSSAKAAGLTDASNPTERARASFHRGVQLYGEGSFEAALAEFRKAYQWSPNYRLLYNIAQTYFELHDYVNASRSLKQYSQEGGSEITPERRAEVADLNQKLEERIAHLDIVCNLDGADLRVDDISVGVSPLAAPILVNAGPRRVTAIKAGHPVVARMVTVAGAEKAKVMMDIPAAGEPTAIASPRPGMTSDASVAIGQNASTPQEPRRAGLITSAVIAGGCAITTGVFGYLALKSKHDFDLALGRIPNTKDNVDSARSKMKTYAHLTDAFGAATLVSGAVVLYYLLSDGTAKKARTTKSSVALLPTAGGMVLHGHW